MSAPTCLIAFAAAALAAVDAAAKPAPKLECGEMSCQLFDSPAKAFAEVLATKPRILAVGEVHQTNETKKIRSALKRFIDSMLPLLKHRASDLIAETWVAEGKCGVEEEQAVEEIAETTQRPEQTEDEVVTLLLRARDAGARPHILEVSCDQYRTLLDESGELDADRLLKLVTKLLLEKAKALDEKNQERESKRMVVIYGGAIHNDVEPAAEYAEFSYGRELDSATEGRYAELDLYVPELIEGDEEYAKEVWFPFFAKHVSKTKTLLIRVRPSAFVLVFPKKR